MPPAGAWVGVLSTGLSAIGAVYLFTQIWQQQPAHFQLNWLTIPGAGAEGSALNISAGIYLDNLSATMLVLASFISLLVQIYSLAYMKGDPGYTRYFAFLGLFTGSMLAMVVADNLLVLFLFWELVGFSSYLLIGFWRERDEAGRASMKAFLVNRVSDLALLAGLLLIWALFGTFDLLELKQLLGENTVQISTTLLTILGLCLFAGCVGKSAQFPLQVWLPDAMAGPTPVSSLLHAATMVAAGVFLLARCYVFFSADVLLIMAVTGTITMVLGAVAALGQYDIKRVLAYSTVSQLGYMVMGMGVGAYDASLLHLITHAFFKAALFLLAGIVIHYVHHQHNPIITDAQDMRQMGGLRKKMPVTFVLYLIAVAALVGLPFFSGFLSKDALLVAAWNWADTQAVQGNWAAFLVPDAALLTVLLTAWYMGRQIWMVFIRRPFSETPLSKGEGPGVGFSKEASPLMLIPVIILSVFCLGIFFSLNPFNPAQSWLMQGFAADALSAFNLVPEYQLTYLKNVAADHNYIVPLLSVGLVLAGLLLAWRIGHNEEIKRIKLESAAVAGPSRLSGLFAPLVFHTVLMDKFYAAAFVRPVLKASALVYAFDKGFIDRFLDITGKSFVVLAKLINWADRVLVDGVVRLFTKITALFSLLAKMLQSGRVQSYYVVALIGMVLLVALLLWSLSAN